MGFKNYSMKKLFFTFLSILSVLVSMAQAKKPTLMILPSDNWCVQRYFISEFDNQGTKMKVPNYKQAFQEDAEIGQVISKIGSLMIDRGFPLKDAEQEIKNLEQQSAEDNMTTSAASGSSLSESPLDKLKKRAKADIIIQIWWSLNKTAEGRSVNFTLEAFDAYTSKRIAASTGTGAVSANEVVPVMLQQAVNANIDPFVAQLQSHFTDMFENGREITVRIKKWQNWSNNLETEFDGKELTDIITEWMQKNTVKGRHNVSDATENMMTVEQVRIPVIDANGKAIDARLFLKDLQKYLKAAPYNIESKLMIRGLGEAILVLGEK
jgi:hypothetical protein